MHILKTAELEVGRTDQRYGAQIKKRRPSKKRRNSDIARQVIE
jgi:hypothetical protein